MYVHFASFFAKRLGSTNNLITNLIGDTSQAVGNNDFQNKFCANI